MISVIIATKNRDAALRDISLPSLLAQDTIDFEVIVWDASDNDRSEKVAGDFASRFGEKEIIFRYFRAPRAGLPSQRNDAVSEASGEYIFFIDDDSEVSSGGISSVKNCFEKNADCKGVGLALEEKDTGKEKTNDSKKSLKKYLYGFFGYVRTRKVHPSGSNKGLNAPPGPAEWLSGCSMAYRREVFEVLSFNEKLQAFGGYALCEDVEFSHRVFLHYRHPLLVPWEGRVVHHEVEGARTPESEEKTAMFFYNRYILMLTSSQRAPLLGRAGFVWNMTRRFISMAFQNGFMVTFKGFCVAWKKIFS